MEKSEQLTLFRQGVNAWNSWRAKNPTENPVFDDVDVGEFLLTGTYLNGINLNFVSFNGGDLSRAYLNEAKLRGVTFRKTNLSGAHLIEADFREADLQGVVLRNAYLMGVDFSEADLHEADLSGAHLRGANFFRANLEKANFQGIDLRETNLREVNLHGASLRETDLRQKCFQKANLVEADLSQADLSGVDFRDANLRGTNFSGANLRHANLCGADLSEANFSEADLHETNLSDAILWRADFRGAHLESVNFCGADLSDANFRGTDLWGLSFEKNALQQIPSASSRICEIPSNGDIRIDETTVQSNLILSQPGEPVISVDKIEIAQLIYLLLQNEKLRSLIAVMAEKVVLILGRFTPDRKPILDAIREGLRNHDYLPVLFDFENPGSQTFTEVVSTLAGIARFVIADFTDASVAYEEVPHIIRDVRVPIQPLLAESVEEEPSTLADLRKHHAVILDTYRYVNSGNVRESFELQVISPAEAKVKQLRVA